MCSPGRSGTHFLKFDAGVGPPRRDLRTGARSARQLQFRRHVHRQRAGRFHARLHRSDSVNPAHTNTDLYNYWVSAYPPTTISRSRRGSPSTSACAGTTFQRYKQKDDQFVEHPAQRLRRREHGGHLRPRPSAASLMAPTGTTSDRASASPGVLRIGGETVVRGGYGIYYTSADLERHFRHGGRRAGHRRRVAQRQHRGRAESLLQQSFRAAQSPTAR